MLVTRHLRIGWTALALFSAAGLTLELLHAWKVAGYLDGADETRRLLWTLAHAHGVGLGLLNLGFAATAHALARDEPQDAQPSRALELSSSLLSLSTWLMPLSFFLGGIGSYESDPGAFVWLVPPAALALVVAALLMAREVWKPRS
jgi:hypothetical protein